MRHVGLARILYGTDMSLSWNPTPRDWWRRTVLTLPLNDEEIADIADDVPPYIRPEANLDPRRAEGSAQGHDEK
jgi:hypothetical protein